MKRILLVLLSIVVSTSLYSQEKKGRRILYIGDSITDGNWGRGDGKPSSERNHWDWNHLYGSGYVYLCVAHYMGLYPELEYVFFNRGSSGNTLEDLEKRWKEDAIDVKPDVISILIGTNDAYRYTANNTEKPFDYDAWNKRYRSLIDSSLEANPELKIVLCSPFIANTGSMRKDKNFAVRDTIVRHCSKIVESIAKDYNAVFLPYQQLFDNVLLNKPTSIDTYWIWDGVHPTPAGHRLMADMWIKTVGVL